MMTFAHVAVAPALAGFGFGFAPLMWPSGGAILAWLLLTALVGSALGTLRAATSGTVARSLVVEPMPRPAARPDAPAPPHDARHREAA